jgi:hypothetical protein
MSNGQGSVTFSEPPGSGGGGGGAVTAADNGTSLNGTTVVLGNDRGDAAMPAALLNERSIPLQGFGILFDWEGAGAGSTSFFQITSGGTAMLEYYKGATGQEPLEIVTIQGQNPGPNPYGNFWITLDESYTNPDGQIDAVLQWGYNQNGTGGVRLAGEAACWFTLESHFDSGGSSQFEVELASVTLTGTPNRYVQIDINKHTGEASAQFAFDGVSIFPTNNGLLDPYFILNGSAGTMQTIGTAPAWSMTNSAPASGQFNITSNNDGSINISNGTTGADPQIVFANPLTVNNMSAAFSSIQVNLINSGGVQGFYAVGNEGSYSIPFRADITGTGTAYSQVNNYGTGGAAFLANSASASSEIIFANTASSNLWAVGLDNIDAKFKIANTSDVHGAPNLLTFTNTGQGGFGNNLTPTAILHIGASPGTAGLGPIKLTAAPLLAVPEDGLIEYDGTNFYKTIGAVRSVIV